MNGRLVAHTQTRSSTHRCGRGLARVGRVIEWWATYTSFDTSMKIVHVAEMIAQGGREGSVEAAEGSLRVELSSDEQRTMTPEHLFAGAYASGFLTELKHHAEKAHVPTEGMTVVGRAHLEEDDKGGQNLHIELRAALPGVSKNDAKHLMNLAHQSCPYSRATRGNITVNLSFD
jgi:lipoyl-dependent peroxiredoxin